MTQIATPQPASILTGPRGIGARSLGGGYSQDAQQDIQDTDCFQSPVTLLSGTTDNITPVTGQGGNYIVKSAGANAMTGVAPRAGLDDGLTIAVYSDTAQAHTITFATNCIADGTAGGPHHIITFTTGFRGQGVTLRAFNGTWQVISNTACAIT